MTKFNKSLLTAAVVGALALPGMASAASLAYATGTQITFAKDLIVNNGTTIYSANSLQLTATAPGDAANMATVAALSTVTVKVTLTNNAKFDTTAAAPVLVAGFFTGTQFGAPAAALTLVGTPYYSTSGQELNFSFRSPGVGNAGAGYALELNSMQITNLMDGLFTGSSVSAEITAQNSLGQQILAAKKEIATSKWGLTVTDVASADTTKTIDVGSTPRKTLFSPSGAVGGSGVVGDDYFNAGGFALDVAKALPINQLIPTYINNYNAVAANPQYNVVATADVVVTVTGTDFSAFTGTRVWLDQSAVCAHAGGGTSTNATIATATPGIATFTSPATAVMWAPVTAASPGPATAYVCFGANNVAEMVPQALAGSVSVDYKLTTQRVNPPAMPFSLMPLRLNGTTIIFQNVNPGANASAQSFLRMTNNNAQICPVSVDAKDDAGLHTKEWKVTLGAHTSKQVNSDVLEATWGDGTGKWYVRITAECSNFKASALNRHQDGVVTDLTPEKWNGSEWLTPPTML